jgi:hypothetical protein
MQMTRGSSFEPPTTCSYLHWPCRLATEHQGEAGWVTQPKNSKATDLATYVDPANGPCPHAFAAPARWGRSCHRNGRKLPTRFTKTKRSVYEVEDFYLCHRKTLKPMIRLKIIKDRATADHAVSHHPFQSQCDRSCFEMRLNPPKTSPSRSRMTVIGFALPPLLCRGRPSKPFRLPRHNLFSLMAVALLFPSFLRTPRKLLQ